MPVPIIDPEKCNACGDCVDACPPQAISLVDEVARINERFCEECSECVDECPEKAISLPKR
jgi:electron transfer flavoprotein alpha subunit